MQIVAPISRLDEIESLAQAGADELYCGVVPEAWTRRYGHSGANRRIFGNLASLDDLQQALSRSQTLSCRLSLVMNAQHYAADQLPWLSDMASWFDERGGHALIVSDPMLLAKLAALDLGLRLHLSSVAACRNSAAVAFFAGLGADRIVLPRDVTAAEVAAIAERNPDTELEVFVLNDGCVFEEGHCQTLHLPTALGGPICLDTYTSDHRRRDGRSLSARSRQAMVDNDQHYADWLWYRFGCGFSTTPAGDPYGPCGLCAMPGFNRAGISAIKIAGREGDSERKRRSVVMVKRIRDACLAQGSNPDAVKRQAVGLRDLPEHCRKAYMCYYPDQRSPDL